MRRLSRPATAVGLIGLALAMTAGAILGVRLGSSASEAGVSELRIADPELFAGPPVDARRSSGGFTGFGLAALPGEVIAGGELVSVEPSDDGGGTLVFRDGGRQTSVRYLDDTRLFELVANADLALGDTVLLRLNGSKVVGLLRIAVDVEADASQ